MTPLDTLLKHVAQLRPVDPTECVDEPEFDPGRLLAWQAGAEDEDAVRHLAACAACRALLAGLEPLSEAAVERALEELERPPVVVGEPEPSVAAVDEPGPPSVAMDEPPSGVGRPRRRLAWFFGSATLAAAAGVVAIWAGQTRPPPPPIFGHEVKGGVKTHRDVATRATRTFLPHSKVRWVIRPWTAVRPTPVARAFRVEEDRLIALPAQAVRVEPSGTVVIEGSGAALLGTRATQVALLVAIAWETEALDRVANQSASQARESVEVLVFEEEFDYRP